LDEQIPLNKLPLAALLSYMEINPPNLPYNSLSGRPTGIPFSILNEEILSSTVTGFSASLGSQLAAKNYAHLMVVMTVKSGGAAANVQLGFNADIATNYQYSYTGSSSASAGTQTSITIPSAAGASASSFRAASLLLIPNFLESGVTKSMVGITGIVGGSLFVCDGGWLGTNAVTQLDFSCSANMQSGSRFSFYALGAQ
jgi:hypothetical protein